MNRALVPAAALAVSYGGMATAAALISWALRGPSSDLIVPVVFSAYPAAGLLIIWGRGSHPIGWILLLAGPAVIIAIAGQSYALFAAVHRWPLHDQALVAGNTVWTLMLLLFGVLLPLLFPTGRLLSRRWGVVIALWALYTGLVLAGNAFEPGPLVGRDPRSDNPIGIAGHEQLFAQLAQLSLLPGIGALGGVVASVVVRYRRSAPAQRQQLKLFLCAAALIPIPLILHGFPPWDHVSFVLVFPLLPIAIAVAILRYRLYDIDVVISRTLAYVALAALITGVYVAIVVGAGSLLGQAGRPNLLLSILATAIVAVAFQPARERLLKLANRIVLGPRSTPYEVLADFAREVGSFGGQDVLHTLARVLADGTRAERAEVWLGGDLAASVGTAGTGEERSVEVWHQAELLGALRVVKRRGEGVNPREAKLLLDLANQAGLVLRNVGLTRQLELKVEELWASRQRLVQVQDEERRRLERDLRDGAQRDLVKLQAALGQARTVPAGRVRPLLADLEADAGAALAAARELARGIYPALLQDRGLAEAIAARARRAPLPVDVTAEGVGRHAQAVEAGVYFCVQEALRNIQAHAGAESATIQLTERDGLLAFEVVDDGCGFDPEVKAGTGLTNIRDRIDALGGDVLVESAPGGGTRVAGAVPVGVPVA